MSLRDLPHRFVVWGNKNPFLMAIIFDLAIIAAGLTAFQIQNDRDLERAKVTAVSEAKHRAEEIAKAVAESNLDVCRRAVTAVSNGTNADLLKIVKTVEDRFVEQGRPIPEIYLQLELQLTNREPPVAACQPKESP